MTKTEAKTEGCWCYNEWGNDVEPICDKFVPDSAYPAQCGICEHDQACHREERIEG